MEKLGTVLILSLFNYFFSLFSVLFMIELFGKMIYEYNKLSFKNYCF